MKDTLFIILTFFLFYTILPNLSHFNGNSLKRLKNIYKFYAQYCYVVYYVNWATSRILLIR